MINVLVERNDHEGEQPEGLYLLHLREQWEAALEEILKEHGYVFMLISGGLQYDGFKIRWNGNEPTDGQMAEFSKLAAIRCGHLIE